MVDQEIRVLGDENIIANPKNSQKQYPLTFKAVPNVIVYGRKKADLNFTVPIPEGVNFNFNLDRTSIIFSDNFNLEEYSYIMVKNPFEEIQDFFYVSSLEELDPTGKEFNEFNDEVVKWLRRLVNIISNRCMIFETTLFKDLNNFPNIKSGQTFLRTEDGWTGITIRDINSELDLIFNKYVEEVNKKIQEHQTQMNELLEQWKQDIQKYAENVKQYEIVRVVTQTGHGFVFEPVMYSISQRKFVKAVFPHGADGVAIRVDDNNFRLMWSGRVEIPVTAKDTQQRDFVLGEYYFLGEGSNGGIQREKPDTYYQHLFQVMYSDELQQNIADVLLSVPINQKGKRWDVGEAKTTVNDIEELKMSDFPVGKVVEVLGYYSADDGADHKRIIKAENDGSGVQLSNKLWACIVHNGEVNVSWFGAKGDGVTDDTENINRAMNYINSLDIYKTIVFNKKYKLFSTLELNSNTTVTGGGTLIFYDKAADDKKNLITIISPKENVSGDEQVNKVIIPKENITIDNITINYTNQINKGGRAADNYKLTCVKPELRGSIGIGVNGKNITIKNCTLKDIYGDGIVISNSFNVFVLKNNILDCAASNIVSGETGYDNHGDGIVAFHSRNIRIINNIVKNTRKFLSDEFKEGLVIAEGKTLLDYHCSRSGLEYEYDVKADKITLKDFLEEKNIEGENLIFDGNYVEGYAKGVHLESNVKCKMVNNKLFNNYIHVMGSAEVICDGNFFNVENLSPWLQSGYNQFFNAVGISNYGVTERINTVSNNTFYNGAYVINDAGHINIVANKFFKSQCLSQKDDTLNRGAKLNFIFDSNYCEDCKELWTFSYSKGTISNNTFYNTKKGVKYIEGDLKVDDITAISLERGDTNILNNRFFGSVIVATSDAILSKIEDNDFYNTNTPITLNGIRKGSIINNTFRYREKAICNTNSLENITISNNIFECIYSENTNSPISLLDNIYCVSILNNVSRSLGKSEYFINSNWKRRSCLIKNNINANIGTTPKLCNFKEDLTNEVIISDNVNFFKETVIQIQALNTLYHMEKMKQEGVYNDFITYMDEKTLYDKQQRKLEQDRQLAYEEALKENPELTYEEFMSVQPMTLNLVEEPQPSDALKKFMEKYL